MSYDDQYLFTVSEDACLFIFKAVDKEGRGLKRDKEVGYAEEILITKSDLEEKVRHFVVTLKIAFLRVYSYWIVCYLIHVTQYHTVHVLLYLLFPEHDGVQFRNGNKLLQAQMLSCSFQFNLGKLN